MEEDVQEKRASLNDYSWLELNLTGTEPEALQGGGVHNHSPTGVRNENFKIPLRKPNT